MTLETNLTVQIRELVLDGIAVPRREFPALQTALESELAQLISTNGLAPSLLHRKNMPDLPVGAFHFDKNAPAAELGQEIARAVYAGLKP